MRLFDRFPAALALGALMAVAPMSQVFADDDKGPWPAGTRNIESGQPSVQIFPTIEGSRLHSAAPTGAAAAVSNLTYHGGKVETAPVVYLVFWGSQWSNDPSFEAVVLQNFFNHVGGSSWANINTQYTQGTGQNIVHAGNLPGMLKPVWWDTAAAAPTHPTQSQLAAEAVKAAAHFGSASNVNAQYVIATAHGNSSSGFGTQYCAWHSSTGNIAYTNLPYMTDAGSSCGANFNGLGATAGITIVAGHEFAETVTDPFPSSGWVDSKGAEIGDKCSWTSGTKNVSLNGVPFPVQPLWSNAVSGCAISY